MTYPNGAARPATARSGSSDQTTLADLRRAAELLPFGAFLTLPRDALLAAIADAGGAGVATDTPVIADPERWLTAEQVAETYHVTRRWCYDHAKALGARHLSRRCVRFPERGIERFLARRNKP